MNYTCTFHFSNQHGIQDTHVFWREKGLDYAGKRIWRAEVFLPESPTTIFIENPFPPSLTTSRDAITEARRQLTGQRPPTTD
jgi:hypothetical protein